ncbi:hypothetical protein BVRB_8g200860 [Beta vulgaris subsp. vulgaris]|uniref:Bromo domain-containing protein n=2 Tax=Beta vulgaris subsp. vulgaris TaxID=3555 RepID=A0A0J8E0N1_BETVV|nr:hypothetical protein BVRB_8g200860 [Beta vulgaris subsp. vulgaris]
MISEVTKTVPGVVPSKRLRVKILAKKPVDGTCDVSRLSEAKCFKKPSLRNHSCNAVVSGKKLKLTSGTTKDVIGACQLSKQVPNSIVGCKRKTDEVLDSQERKSLKMDRFATSNCQSILQKLMKHRLSVPFLTPVVPDVWGIYDYFDIIKNPMDLGTIKEKLMQKTYIDTAEFEDDVRLTFSNAMLYNPPHNWVHQDAKELSRLFDSLWKPVKTKMDREYSDMNPSGYATSRSKVYDVKGNCLLSISSGLDRLPGKAMSQKENRSEDLKKLSTQGIQNDQRAVKDGKPKESLSSKSNSDFIGHISQIHKESAPRISAKVKCENAPRKKVANDDFSAVKVKSTSTLQRAKYDRDGDGDGTLSSVNEEHDIASACAAAAAGSFGASVKGSEIVLDAELSPSKALHAAKMISRFAETILKAQHHKLLEPDSGADAAIRQQEKERLQKKQHQEKARIEAQLRAVQSAKRSRAEAELRKQRQQEREAARLALEKMEQSVDLVDNLQVLKDMEDIIGSSLAVMYHDRRSRATMWSHIDSDKLSSPLERLGLYIKEEYRVGDDDDYAFQEEGDWEEGELIV